MRKLVRLMALPVLFLTTFDCSMFCIHKPQANADEAQPVGILEQQLRQAADLVKLNKMIDEANKSVTNLKAENEQVNKVNKKQAAEVERLSSLLNDRGLMTSYCLCRTRIVIQRMQNDLRGGEIRDMKAFEVSARDLEAEMDGMFLQLENGKKFNDSLIAIKTLVTQAKFGKEDVQFAIGKLESAIARVNKAQADWLNSSN